MEHIIQAVQRAKKSNADSAQHDPKIREIPREAERKVHRDQSIADVEVSLARLEGMRVVAHDPGDPRSKSFDLLRTQVLQAMTSSGWRLIGITSPTPGCGKTFTAINLTLSVARQPNSSALLVDLDLSKPQIAHRLGLQSRAGVRTLLEGRTSLEEALTWVSLGGFHFGVLPCERPSTRSSDWIGSAPMLAALQALRADEDLKIVILDLPPILSGDDVISILPHIDCVLMVAEMGKTTTVEMRECAKYLQSTPVVRIVLNRAPETPSVYY